MDGGLLESCRRLILKSVLTILWQTEVRPSAHRLCRRSHLRQDCLCHRGFSVSVIDSLGRDGCLDEWASHGRCTENGPPLCLFHWSGPLSHKHAEKSYIRIDSQSASQTSSIGAGGAARSASNGDFHRPSETAAVPPIAITFAMP